MNGCGEEIVIDIGGLLAALWRRRRRVLLAAVLCGISALLGSLLFLTPRYLSTVTFYVSAGGQSPEYACMFLLKTEETLQGVIDLSGVPYSCGELEKMVSAEAVDAAQFFSVTAAAADAGEAKAIAEAVAQVLPQRITAVVDGISLKVASAPKTAEKPGSPDHLKNALIGLLAGAAAAGGGVVLGEISGRGEAGKFEGGRASRKGTKRI